MRVCVMQPAYLPWPGYFDRMAQCEVLILWDHVAFSDKHRDNFVNRNRIRDGASWRWLTIPVHAPFGTRICDVRTADDQWAARHARAIRAAYPESDWSWLRLEPVSGLVDACLATVASCCGRLGMADPRIVRGSRLALPAGKTEALLAACRIVGATAYLSGPQGRAYLDLPAWDAAGIAVTFHDYPGAAYPAGREPLVPLSAVDAWYYGAEVRTCQHAMRPS